MARRSQAVREGGRLARNSTAGRVEGDDEGRVPAATELAARMAEGVPQANGAVAVEALMEVRHVARSVVQMARLPLEADVQFLTLMATQMPFVGRG